MVNIELAHQAGGGIPVIHAQLSPRAIAVGVHRGLGHAQFAGDLLGRQMLIDQAQALALSGREQADGVGLGVRAYGHRADNKRRRALYVQFSATKTYPLRYA